MRKKIRLHSTLRKPLRANNPISVSETRVLGDARQAVTAAIAVKV